MSEPTPTLLETRVRQFQCLELPGQPMNMHVGTAYLVRDLWKEVERLRSLCGSLAVDNDRLLRRAVGIDR